MRKFTCDPKLELLGTNLMGFVHNMQSEEIIPIMEKHGLADVQTDKWYPAQKWLDVLNELYQMPNVTSNMVAMGMEVGRTLVLPPGAESIPLPDLLMSLETVYQSVHRGGDAGHVICEKLSDTHYKIISSDLYPDDFAYGLNYGLCKRFLPAGTNFKVYYDADLPSRDEDGSETTVIHIEW